MLARGRAAAAAAQVSEHIATVLGDLNDWQPGGPCAAVVANQSLHHVVNLEGLLAAVAQAIGRDGSFVVSDMIGRNGHMRWPEALAIVEQFWAELPRPYRYHAQLRQQHDRFVNWDCSREGFEGIRAQDILPLLRARFGFEMFYPFANLVDPFLDRGFGPHFDPDRAWDRDFIDRVQARDESEILAGRIKPTHMYAVLRGGPVAGTVQWRHLSPEFCMRVPEAGDAATAQPLRGSQPAAAEQPVPAAAELEAILARHGCAAASLQARHDEVVAVLGECAAGHPPDQARRMLVAGARDLHEALCFALLGFQVTIAGEATVPAGLARAPGMEVAEDLHSLQPRSFDGILCCAAAPAWDRLPWLELHRLLDARGRILLGPVPGRELRMLRASLPSVLRIHRATDLDAPRTKGAIARLQRTLRRFAPGLAAHLLVELRAHA
jgi:hypothetical protein